MIIIVFLGGLWIGTAAGLVIAAMFSSGSHAEADDEYGNLLGKHMDALDRISELQTQVGIRGELLLEMSQKLPARDDAGRFRARAA